MYVIYFFIKKQLKKRLWKLVLIYWTGLYSWVDNKKMFICSTSFKTLLTYLIYFVICNTILRLICYRYLVKMYNFFCANHWLFLARYSILLHNTIDNRKQSYPKNSNLLPRQSLYFSFNFWLHNTSTPRRNNSILWRPTINVKQMDDDYFSIFRELVGS